MVTDDDVIQYYENVWSKNFYGGWNLLKKSPEIFNYIMNRFSDADEKTSVSEYFYRVKHKVEEVPKCPICGKRLPFARTKYAVFCSRDCALSKEGTAMSQKILKETNMKKYGVQCSLQAESVKEKAKETLLKKYGVENSMQSDDVKKKVKNTLYEKYGNENYVNVEKCKQTKLERYGSENYNNTEKNKQTCLERYGVDNAFKLEEKKRKIKQTCLERYGVEYASQSEVQKQHSRERFNERFGTDCALSSQEVREKAKKTCIKKYGVDCYNKSDEAKKHISKILSSKEIQNKINESKRKNNSFSSSTIQNDFKTFLEENYKGDYETEYMSEKYPFRCDFYIKSLDLYIEIQGSWTHGHHPFDKDSEEDIIHLNTLNKKAKTSDYYKKAIEVWTSRDTKKRKYAKDNNLNYLEIFTCDIENAIKIFNEHVK